MAGKGDWRKVKSLLSDSYTGGNRNVTPVFIHWNEAPVRARPQSKDFFGASDHEFSYLVTLFKRKAKYQADLYFYVLDFDKETPLINETKHFGSFDYKNLIDFIATPNKIFNLSKKHKNVRTYSNVRMTQGEFDREVEICRKKQT